MSRSFTQHAATAHLDWMFNPAGTAVVPHPNNLVLELYTSIPNDTAGGIEPSVFAGYVAPPIVFGPAALEGTAIVCRNTNQVVFPGPTAPWGKIVAWGVRDSITGYRMAMGYMGTLFDYIYSIEAAFDLIYTIHLTRPPSGTKVFIVGHDPDGNPIGNPLTTFGIDRFENALTEYWTADYGFDLSGFSLSLTSGGPAVDLTDGLGARRGDFQIWLSKTITPGLGDLLVFAPGTISISLK